MSSVVQKRQIGGVLCLIIVLMVLEILVHSDKSVMNHALWFYTNSSQRKVVSLGCMRRVNVHEAQLIYKLTSRTE